MAVGAEGAATPVHARLLGLSVPPPLLRPSPPLAPAASASPLAAGRAEASDEAQEAVDAGDSDALAPAPTLPVSLLRTMLGAPGGAPAAASPRSPRPAAASPGPTEMLPQVVPEDLAASAADAAFPTSSPPPQSSSSSSSGPPHAYASTDAAADGLPPATPSPTLEAPPRPVRPLDVAISLVLAGIYAGAIYTGVTQSARVLALDPGVLAPAVRPGWLWGHPTDVHDPQWRMFRRYAPLFLVSAAVHVACSRLYRRLRGGLPAAGLPVVAGLVTIAVLHGSDALLVLLLGLANFALARATAGRAFVCPAATWVFNIAALLAVQLTDGFDGLLPHALDAGGGLLPWSTYFKLTMLRQISFSMDLHWMRACRAPPPARVLEGRGEYTRAQETHRPPAEYGLAQYLAYLYYPPLFVAGPIVSFNAFAAQLESPLAARTPAWRYVALALRTALHALLLEVGLAFFYQVVFAERGLWRIDTLRFPPFTGIEVALSGYWTLVFVFLKLLVIWRSFRLWALLDGVEAPENLPRCVNNNFTFQAFWRSWHHSLNRWVVRYMYVPLGGRRFIVLSSAAIFTFIGLWHDLWTRWVAWAWINCVCLSVEVLIGSAAARSRWLRRAAAKPWYNYVVPPLAGVVIMFFLGTANLAIFFGFEGTPVFLARIFLREDGMRSLLLIILTFYCSSFVVQLVRREEEKARAKGHGRVL